MSTEIILTVPARHLQPGDHTAGFVVSSQSNFPDGSREYKFVVPSTSAYITVLVQERHLDSVSFPLTKRGDDYSPNARNAALGLPPVPPKVYVAPEPVAVYPVGTRVADIHHFDRSMHLQFQCPRHGECSGRIYSSKDPYVSSWFSQGDYSPSDCATPTNEYVLVAEYRPTRNG